MINTAMLSPVKQESAIAAQTYLNELKDKVSELDIGLLDIKQQVEAIIAILRSLKAMVISKQIEDHNPPFAKIFNKIHQRFIAISRRLSHFMTIDWITKGLLLEVTSLMERMIDEYFLEPKSLTDWEALQQELFSQLEQHLLQTSHNDESVLILSLEADMMENNDPNDVANDPFHLDSPLEALHLFDQAEQEFSLQGSGQFSHQNDDLTTLFPSIIDSSDEIDLDDISDFDELAPSTKAAVPMPEILADIFLTSADITTQEKLTGNDDETELQGFNWKDIENEFDFDAHEDDLPPNDDWHQFNTPEAWSSIDEEETSLLNELTASFYLADDDQNEELDFIVDTEIYDFLQNIDAQMNEQMNEQIINDQINEQIEYQPLPLFDTPDIDTAIEESPIYQNKQNLNQSLNQNLEDYDQDIQFVHDQQYHYGTFQKNLADIDNANDRLMDGNGESGNNTRALNVQIPYEYLERLGDISEDLVIRKGAIASYLNGIRGLSSEINRDLALLDGHNTSQLKQNLEALVAVLERTEQQTELMNSDIRQLRQHLYQTLKCPLSGLTARFPRVLHDLAGQYGKQVDLVVQGADIGLEKVVAEAIAEPLHLLLRYCLQSNIELPAERQQQGKPPQGKIEIIASQNDAIVEIKISDDGRSIDVPMPDHLVKLCDDVQQRLQPIGGKFVVQPAMSSPFIFTLPNSLSLIRVLLITINRMCLAIPSKSILEVLPMPNTDGRSLHLLEWQNHAIPIVKLDEALMLNCRPAQGQFASWEHEANHLRNEMPMPTYLVVESDGKLGALQVDNCWGHQDATLHRVEGDIALPPMFAGAVILATNQAIALLNPRELIQRSLGQEPKANHGEHNGTTALSASSGQLWTAANPDNINSIHSLSDFFNNIDNNIDHDHNVDQSQLPMQPLALASLPSQITSQITSQIKVLIVESSANVRRYLAMTLAKCGFLTEQAQNSQKAIALIKAKQQEGTNIDVVITDLEMPQMDGFKFLSSMRSDFSLQNLPVIVLTAHNNENDQKLALELGAKAFFSKPYREQELIETLKKLVT
ncbi:response regulator [Pseudanabaena sp. FACHB-1277]|uniref:histidine kinase n=1 Tax=Pseudanabaena cinerea FACHB-1277 TaxID=2949581 RepID=A0A926Z7Z7_9CYAN|nr:hybrid sensor histidine kinase/response regulator [Pseudanabaena cinerea]MBD2152148.1 response regulator [Pseudanabaena cinerea FACHB-1277]